MLPPQHEDDIAVFSKKLIVWNLSASGAHPPCVEKTRGVKLQYSVSSTCLRYLFFFSSSCIVVYSFHLPVSVGWCPWVEDSDYHLNKYKPDKISKTCPHCLAAEETTNHYIGQCPKWSAQRSAVFDSFYLSISEVVDDFSIFVIMKYINATGRLNPITEWED